MDQEFPQIFGNYTIHALVARGGMAEIYRATMPGIGGFEKTVAIKKILPHLAANDEFITMLINEAQIVVGLNHSNIAQVYDLGKIGDTYYIAMEYVHGVDLARMIKMEEQHGRRIPISHALYIASGLCSGLHVAHSRCDEKGNPLHIVHRDISPHNVLISFSGDVKIIDFGVAKAASREGQTKIGVIKGKLLYMAPEQAMAKGIDGRADLFSVGLVLYKMLTSRLPFDGDNEFQIYNNILSKDIAPPQAFNPEVNDELNQIVMTLLQRQPQKRFQDGYTAKQELERALHNLAPGYSFNRFGRYIEDQFGHLAQQRRHVDHGQDLDVEIDATVKTPRTQLDPRLSEHVKAKRDHQPAQSLADHSEAETVHLERSDFLDQHQSEDSEAGETLQMPRNSPQFQSIMSKLRASHGPAETPDDDATVSTPMAALEAMRGLQSNAPSPRDAVFDPLRRVPIAKNFEDDEQTVSLPDFMPYQNEAPTVSDPSLSLRHVQNDPPAADPLPTADPLFGATPVEDGPALRAESATEYAQSQRASQYVNEPPLRSQSGERRSESAGLYRQPQTPTPPPSGAPSPRDKPTLSTNRFETQSSQAMRVPTWGLYALVGTLVLVLITVLVWIGLQLMSSPS